MQNTSLMNISIPTMEEELDRILRPPTLNRASAAVFPAGDCEAHTHTSRSLLTAIPPPSFWWEENMTRNMFALIEDDGVDGDDGDDLYEREMRHMTLPNSSGGGQDSLSEMFSRIQCIIPTKTITKF